MPLRQARPALLALLALVCPALLRAQTTHTWTGATGGSWADPANWSTGAVPNSNLDTVSFENPAAAGIDLTVALAELPVSIFKINAANTIGSNSVTLGSPTTDTDIVNLAAPGIQLPTINVSTGTLKLNAQLTGTQGFTKVGSGTLSLSSNPHPQTFTGPITLSGGTMLIGSDHDLGAVDNDIFVSASSSLIAAPVDPATPILLNTNRTISKNTGGTTLTIGNQSALGTLEIAGPLSGSGPVFLNGLGSITLSGPNTLSSSMSYQLIPGGLINGRTLNSELRFVGPTAMPPRIFTLVSGTNKTLINSQIYTKIDLGGLPRSMTNFNLFTNTLSTASANSTTTLEINNGELAMEGDGAWSLPGNDIDLEIRLPKTTSVLANGLGIGNGGPTLATSLSRTRVRIGTTAQFNLYSRLSLGNGGHSGRIDALAPGSTLRLRGNTTSNRLSTLEMGNFFGGLAARADAVLDLSDGTLEAYIDRIYIGNGSPAYPATALIKFGNGNVDVSQLNIGSSLNNGNYTRDYAVEQSGGNATFGTIHFGYGNTTGQATQRYRLSAGNFSVGNFTASSNGSTNTTSTLKSRFEWLGGTLKNRPDRNVDIRGLGTARPILEIALSDTSPKTISVDANRSVSIGTGTGLSSDSTSVLLTKTGSGTLLLGGDSTLFTGTLQHLDGTLAFGYSTPRFTAHLGAFVWSSGTLSYDLSPTDSTSDRLLITRTLTRGTAPATTRILNLKSSLGIGAYTLATYASTDLTLADFTATGIRPGYSADFAISPTALTVTLGPDTPHSLWRRTHFSSAANLGPADDLADPDSDGRPNLLEYALASEPLAADSPAPLTLARLPASDSSPARLALTFNRIADPGLTYAVRAASSPSGPWAEVIFTSTGSDNTAGPVTVSDPADLATHPRRFLRLFVTR